RIAGGDGAPKACGYGLSGDAGGGGQRPVQRDGRGVHDRVHALRAQADEVDPVGDVEDLEAQLHLHAPAQVDVLVEGQVEGEERGADAVAAAGVAEDAQLLAHQ